MPFALVAGRLVGGEMVQTLLPTTDQGENVFLTKTY